MKERNLYLLATDAYNIATANKCRIVEDINYQIPGVVVSKYYFFPEIYLFPPVMMSHLQGAGLMSILDRCKIYHKDPEPIATGLRYVHGRSEVLKGDPLVSSVLLVDVTPSKDFDESEFMSRLPDLYRRYLTL